MINKKYLLYGLLFFSVSFILWNCEKEEEPYLENSQSTYKTVSFEKVKSIFKGYKIFKNTTRSDENITIEPDWETLTQDEVEGIDELLTNVEAEVTSLVNSELITKLVFLEHEGITYRAIETAEILNLNDDGSIKNGQVYYHGFSGEYVDGYVIENGIITKRLIKNTETPENSTADRNNDENNAGEGDCDEDLDPDSEFCSEELDEIVISSGGNNTSSGLIIIFIDNNDDNPELVDPGAGDETSGGNGYNNSTNSCPDGKIDDGNGNCICQQNYIEGPNDTCINPCDKINNNINNPQTSQRMVDLGNKTNYSKESGYRQDTLGNYHPLTAYPNGHSLNFAPIVGSPSIGFMHNHLDSFNTSLGTVNPILIFSPSDIISFLKLIENAESNDIEISDIYGTLVTSEGSYTLKFSGDVNSIPDSYGLRNLKKLFEKKMKKKNSESRKEKAFLEFVKANFPEGIDLYKILPNGNVELRSLNENNQVEKLPC